MMDQNKLEELNNLVARNQVEETGEAVSSETTEETADGAVVTEAEAANAPAPKPPVSFGPIVRVCAAWELFKTI